LKIDYGSRSFPVQATKKEGKFDLYNEIRKLVKENVFP